MDKKKCNKIIRSAIQNTPHPEPPDYDLFQPTSVIALFILSCEVELLFIQKADVEGYPWANQMAFPGGHKDKEDLCSQDTALRELSEEVGIARENVDILGSFGHFQTINNKDIEAFAGVWNEKDTIKLDTAEISKVFKISLKYLIDIHKKKEFHIGKSNNPNNPNIPNITQLTYPFEDVLIWGVTAKILYHLIDSLLQNNGFINHCQLET